MDQDHRDHWRFIGLSCIAASYILQDIGEPVRHMIREENELVVKAGLKSPTDIFNRVGGSSNKRQVCASRDGNCDCLFSAVSVALWPVILNWSMFWGSKRPSNWQLTNCSYFIALLFMWCLTILSTSLLLRLHINKLFTLLSLGQVKVSAAQLCLINEASVNCAGAYHFSFSIMHVWLRSHINFTGKYLSFE